MRETTVLCEVVCGAEPAEAPNGADFALRCDDELCAHDGESRIGASLIADLLVGRRSSACNGYVTDSSSHDECLRSIENPCPRLSIMRAELVIAP